MSECCQARRGRAQAFCQRKTLRRKRIIAASFVGLSGATVLAGLPATAQADVFLPTVIGTFGGNASFAHGINAAGKVVGYATNAAGENRAFLYSAGMLTDLGTLGGSASQAFAINNNDHIVGFSRNANGVERAFRYSAGTMTDLSTLGGTVAYAFDINDTGQITGGSTKQFDTLYRAFRLSGATMSDLGTLGGFLGSSEGTGIDSDGTVVGWTSMVDFTQRAFVYRNNTMTTLPTLGGTYSYAEAIRGGVIVGGAFETGNTSFRAVRWSDGTVVNLGTLPGQPSSVAYALNSTGQIVGKSDAGDDVTARAFVHLGGTMIDLNDLLPGNSGWVLQQARGINDAGQIVGFGTYNGQSRGFILNLSGKIWSNPAGGSFATAGNWFSVGAPNASQPAAFPLAATYTVNVSAPAESRSVMVSRGHVTFDIASTTYTVAEQLSVSSGAALTVQGTGVLSAASISSDGTVRVNSGELKLRAGGGTSATRELRFGGAPGAWSGRLDVENNAIVIDYETESPVAMVRDQIRSARGTGAWHGNGIASSLANASTLGLGYAEASAVFSSFPASFAGRPVDNTSVLIRLTRYGDTNLDGVVNLSDFNALAANFGQSDRYWNAGDFNYDGIVNLADFNLLAANFGQSAAGPDVTPDDWASLASAIPEPGSSTVLMAGAVTLLLHRRRSQTA